MQLTSFFRTPRAAVLGFVLVAGAAGAAAAQPTGLVRGRVTGPDGQAVPGATVKIAALAEEGVSREFTLESDDKGTFSQIGVPPGMYRVMAEKQGVGVAMFDVRVRLGATAEVNLQLQPASGVSAAGEAEMKEVDPKAAEALQAAFEAGVALSQQGKAEEAIAKFREAIGVLPECYQCYYNIGVVHSNQKQYDEAEQAFKKAVEIKPDYAEAYSGLANVYNAQRRFDEAAEASAEAAKHSSGVAAALTGANAAEPLVNQGIILWNAGKIPEAKAQFEQALQADPEHAEANYWMGMAYVNEGKLAEAATSLEKYLSLAPDGRYAAQAKGVLSQIKP